MINSVDDSVQPDSGYAGDDHFKKICLIGNTNQIHRLFEYNVSQRVGSQSQDSANDGTYEKCVDVPVDREGAKKEHFNIYDDVSKEKDRQVNPFFENQPNQSAGPKMIWRKWHNKVLKGKFTLLTNNCDLKDSF